MRLLFVRHGQMELRASAAADPAAIDRLFNAEEQGHLTERGLREASQVAERLAAMRIDGLYSSHLHRARETAEVVAERLDIPLHVTERVAEVRVGALGPGSRGQRFVAGVTRSQLPTKLKGAVLGATLIPLYYRAWNQGLTVGGESRAALDARIGAFLDELAARHGPEDTVAVVVHGYLITTLTLGTGMAGRLRVMRRPHIPNGAICEMSLRDGRLLSVRHADAAHLRR